MRAIIGAAALLGAAAAATAADAPQDAAAFGAREYIRDASLSPDGTKIALVTAGRGLGEDLLIVDMVAGGDPRPITATSGDPEHLTDCTWSDDARLVCGIRLTYANPDGGRIGFSRLLSIGIDGRDRKMLSADTGTGSRALGVIQDAGGIIDWLPGSGGAALMTRVFVPESSNGTRVYSKRSGLGVERVDTRTLARTIVEEPSGNAVDYITDGHGNVRIMGYRPPAASGYAGDTIRYMYRAAGSREWKPFSAVALEHVGTSRGFDPYAVDARRNAAIGFERVDGRQVVSQVALDGSGRHEVLLARPDVDVDGLIRIGRDRRVVGASFATDVRRAEMFDPELRRLADALGRALPGRPAVTFVDASADETKLLMFAGSDTDPGRYYLYDKASRKLEEVLAVRPQLAGRTLATVKPITYPAADGTPIPAYLTLPPGSTGKGLPAIVMPHGGPGARDEWSFDWLAQFYAARGYVVLQPNFRGSSGYGDAWFQKNGFQSWRTAVGDIDDAGRWLTAQGIAAPGKLAIVGWSYGGYAALQSGVLDPGLFKAIVAVAPVTDMEAVRTEARTYANFVLVDRFVGNGPHIQQGSPARNAAAIKVPVLMFHGTEDTNVGIGQSRLMAARLQAAGGRAELVEFKGLDHQLDDAGARAKLLERSDAFLRGAMGL